MLCFRNLLEHKHLGHLLCHTCKLDVFNQLKLSQILSFRSTATLMLLGSWGQTPGCHDVPRQRVLQRTTSPSISGQAQLGWHREMRPGCTVQKFQCSLLWNLRTAEIVLNQDQTVILIGSMWLGKRTSLLRFWEIGPMVSQGDKAGDLIAGKYFLD